MSSNGNLGDRQQHILKVIREVSQQRGYPPSVREIGGMVGLASSSTVQSHLDALERKGLIKRDATKSRTVTVLDHPESQPGRAFGPLIPLVGRVAAGSPILAEENVEDYLQLSPQLAREGCFALRVQGDSMRDAGICDGDLVVVEPGSEVIDGTIVVAELEGEATIKRVYRDGHRFRLEPANPDYKPLLVDQLDVAGRVRALVRLFS